ncbi:MAG: GIN domain-containing protein [Rhizomicrobium sp.]
MLNKKGKSFLGGAAFAAVLILPAAAANGGWVVWPTKTYSADAVRLDDIVGKLTVNVRNGGPVSVDVAGAKSRVEGIAVREEDGKVVIDGSDEGENRSVWNWRNWFNFSSDFETRPDNLTIRVTVPRGAAVDVRDLVGDATIGDTQGALHFEAAATRARIGRVGPAHITLGGAGRLDIAQVSGPLHLEVGGSGKVSVGPTQSVNADIAGAGDAQFGAIAGGLSLDIAGSGNVSAASVNGPTHIDIAGSGSVKIADGTANPLHVDIMGAGNFIFGGVAVDPHIDAIGSGNVKLKSYRGHLDTEGMADVKIGE